jgi:hypothetical protein
LYNLFSNRCITAQWPSPMLSYETYNPPSNFSLHTTTQDTYIIHLCAQFRNNQPLIEAFDLQYVAYTIQLQSTRPTALGGQQHHLRRDTCRRCRDTLNLLLIHMQPLPSLAIVDYQMLDAKCFLLLCH